MSRVNFYADDMHSLTSKGNAYGDADLTTTYRNVRNETRLSIYSSNRFALFQTVILALTGIPGAFLAGWAVDLPVVGRRGTLMIACGTTSSTHTHRGSFSAYALPQLQLLSFYSQPPRHERQTRCSAGIAHMCSSVTSVFVSLSIAHPQSYSAGFHVIVFNLLCCDLQIMYGVLYAISPEIFPAKDRGTGNGLTAIASRAFGIVVSLDTPSHLFGF